MILKTDPDIIKSYLEDSSNLKGGHADRVILPENIEELAGILREEDRKREPVTISGGGTSTTGSRVPFGGNVVSMEKFNGITEVSSDRMSCRCGAGALVEDLKSACESKGLFYASHPTEKNAFVGGTIATNASGARSFKYGPTRKFVRSLRMVLACGEVFEIRRGERFVTRKDSTIRLDSGRTIDLPLPTYRMPCVKSSAGYFAHDGMDLVDLFIGQEGTLSVIVEAEMGLLKAPSGIFSSFVFFNTMEDAWNFAMDARHSSKACDKKASKIDALSIEYFDPNALGLLRLKNANIPGDAKAAIFFEQETEGQASVALIEDWTKIITKNGASIDDTWVAMSEKGAEDFLKFRYAIPESVNEIVKRNGFPKLSADIAVPEEKFLEMMKYYKTTLDGSGMRHVLFGHIGECHVHANILPRTKDEFKAAGELTLGFIKKGVGFGGTVSAEHGIGKLKYRYLEEMYGRPGILEMVRIKKAFDPNCILGLDNIFPKELLK